MGLLNNFLSLFHSASAEEAVEPDYYAPLRRGDHVAAIPLLRRAMRHEDAHAMALYATLLAMGNGIEKNLEDAADWYRQAAVRGELVAQVAFGMCLATGKGVAINQREAAYWLYRAARGGYSPAVDMLGDLVMCDRSVIGEHFSQAEFDALLRLAHRPAGAMLQ